MSLVLRPDEFVKIEVHFSYKVFVFPMLLMSIAILMFLAVISGAADGISVHWLGHIVKLTTVLVSIGVCLLIPYIYKRIDNRLKIYAVTNQRVYIRRGIINIREKDIPLPKINDVQIFQTYVQRIFAAADVVIQVGNDESRIYVDDINRPREFRDTILSAIYEMKKIEDMHKQNVVPDLPPPPQPSYPSQSPYPQQPHYPPQQQYSPQQQYPNQNYGSNYGSSYQDNYNSDNNYHKPYDPDGF